jgi:sugar transferase (PEP-CTERM/EpsH1 system associated)
MTGEILFLAHRIPFPPDRGDKIRSHHVLKALAELAPVHVAAFADDVRDLAFEHELAALTRSYRIVVRDKPLALAAAQALISRRPVSLPAFDHRALRRYVHETLARRSITAIYVFSSQMAQYVPDAFAGRIVTDFVDVDSAKFEAYAAAAAQPLRSAYRREARLLAAHEGHAARRADVSLFVTDEEAALFRGRLDCAANAAAEVRTMGNGIDSDVFDPAGVAPAAELAGVAGPHLMFTGQMDYPPNVAAVERFAQRIMPVIRTAEPRARFHVVGRRPTEAVRALDGCHGTRVWGEVEDIRPWLAAADLIVAPLEIARGVQNKVLEAMAMGRAVLASPEAATGIAARAGVELAVEANDQDFSARALALLRAPDERAAMGEAARAFVLARQRWPAMLAELSSLVGIPPASARHAA